MTKWPRLSTALGRVCW